MVGLFNRLFAWFGYRLLPIKAIEDEQRANARAIEALDGRIASLAEDRDALAVEIERLNRARAEDQADLWGRLQQVRASRDKSRAAVAAAKEALVRQAQTFADRTAADLEARRAVEVELWGRIYTLRSGLEAERRMRAKADRQAQERSEAQAGAHAQALGRLYGRLDLERSRTAAALKSEEAARRKVDGYRKKIESLTGSLEREITKRADAEALAGGIGNADPIRAARGFRARDRLDLAAITLERAVDLSVPKYDSFYLQVLVELEDNRQIQRAVRQSIARLPDVAPESEPDYLTTLCRFAGVLCLEPAVHERFLAKTEWAATKSEPLHIAREAVRRRLQFRRDVNEGWEGHGALISLGLNCMPWTLPNRWGLRSPEEFGSLFTPFSAGVHKFKGLARALATDFENYCQPDRIVSVETKNGHLTAMRTDGTAVWNHNLGPYWLGDDFARLRKTLAEKIQLFRAACRREDAVFILGKAPITYPHEPVSFIETLNEALRPFTGRTNNRLLLWNEHAETAGRHTVDPWTHVLNCPFPPGGYLWHDEETADGPEALAYEGGCAQAIVDSLQDWGLMRPRGEDAGAVAEVAVAAG